MKRKQFDDISLPVDEYGYVIGAETDPYGLLEFAVGSGDDFVCFDYEITKIEGKSIVILHAVLNSETGSFIEGFGYEVIHINNPKFKVIGEMAQEVVSAAANMVNNALEWCSDNEVRHSKSGWNQNPNCFVRAVACAISESEAPRRFSYREMRFGGKTINRYISHILSQ